MCVCRGREGGGGGEDGILGEKGEEVYGRKDKKGWVVGFQRWWEAGENIGKIMQHCTIFHNPKDSKRQEPTK